MAVIITTFILIFLIRKNRGMHHDPYCVYYMHKVHLMYNTHTASTVSQRPAAPEDLSLKRNETNTAESGVSMERNEANSVVVLLKKNEAVIPLQRNEAYSAVIPLQTNEAYESVLRPTNTLDTQTYPEYETIQ